MTMRPTRSCFGGVATLSLLFAIAVDLFPRPANEQAMAGNCAEGKRPPRDTGQYLFRAEDRPVYREELYEPTLKSDRELNISDLKDIAELSVYILDKNVHWGLRETAIMDLGPFGHRYAIPALAAALRDHNENPNIHMRCIEALRKIADPLSVEVLIEDAFLVPRMTDEVQKSIAILIDSDDRPWVEEMDGRPIQLWRATMAERKYVAAIWRKWWKENKDEVKLVRSTALPND